MVPRKTVAADIRIENNSACICKRALYTVPTLYVCVCVHVYTICNVCVYCIGKSVCLRVRAKDWHLEKIVAPSWQHNQDDVYTDLFPALLFSVVTINSADNI